MACCEQLNLSFECKNPKNFVSSQVLDESYRFRVLVLLPFYRLQWQKETNKPSVRYLVYRLALASYFNFVLVFSLITATECNQLKFYAIYLTNWNVMINAFSSLFGAALIVLYYRGKIKFSDESNEMPKAFKLYWLVTTLSTVVCVSLSCIYWPLIYNGRDKGLNDSLTHAGNAIVLFVDFIFINAHPPRLGHFVYPLSFGAFYSLFSLAYTLLGGTDRDGNNFIYSVVDWRGNTTGALGFTLATITFLTIVHFALTLLASLRVRFCKHLRARREEDQSAESNAGYNA